MAFFTKEPAARLRADLSKLTARRDALAEQLEAAKAAVTSLLKDASASDDAAVFSAMLTDAERQVRGLTALVDACDAKVTEAADQIEDIERRRAAQESADAIDVLAADFRTKLAALVQAAATLAPIAERLSATVFGAKSMADLARVITIEAPTHDERIADEARYCRKMIIQRGSEKPARRSEHAA